MTADESNRLISLFQARRYAELESAARQLIGRRKDFGLAWSMLGAALQAQGKDALRELQMAAQLLPDDAATHYNLANLLKDRNQFAESIASYRRALQIRPSLAEAHNNLGNLYAKCWQLDEAAECYKRVLELRPDSPKAYFNLGSTLKDAGRIHEAIAYLRRALELDPEYLPAYSDLLFAYNYLSDIAPKHLIEAARHYGDLVSRRARPYTAWPQADGSDHPLRIGFVSGDLRNHPVGYLMEGVLKSLATDAHERLQIHVYHNHDDTDALSERIMACCHRWQTVSRLADDELARQIHADGIHILFDLSGHTAHNRLPLFAWKPAPVQATWLGYFATTGVAAIDYVLADPSTAPETMAAHFTETIWRLPDTRLCFTAPEFDLATLPPPALQNGFMTFGCFNTLSKLNDAVAAAWAKILQAVPNSRLFLKAAQLDDPPARAATTLRFAALGISPDRLILEGASPRAEYLAAYNRVDIALDPFPYTGGATTADALWMGVPVLTLGGEHFIARQGLGLLTNAGLMEWIASDTDDYCVRAVRHASQPRSLADLRTRLREQVLQSPIFDARRFAGHFEQALHAMWRERLRKAV